MNIFFSSQRSFKNPELPSEVLELLSFPSGFGVPAVEGRYLCDEPPWKDLRLELFVCAELAIEALATVADNLREDIPISLLKKHAGDKFSCVRLSGFGEGVYTFVPTSVLLGCILLHLHKLDVPKKMRLVSQITASLNRALEQYPKVGKEKILAAEKDSTTTSRFAELGITADEFEVCQNSKYEDCYRIMRGLIPPNIARTELKIMLSEGVPRDIAERIWKKKALWLICMHPDDLPKVHIADLRGKYDYHGLDIIEMRALWHVLPPWTGNSQKAEWRKMFKNKLDDMVVREILGTIDPDELRDSAYLGYEGLVVYDPDKHRARQFGIFVAVKDLKPGERRERVFNALSPKEAAAFGIGSQKLHRRRSFLSPNDTEDEEEEEEEETGSSSSESDGLSSSPNAAAAKVMYSQEHGASFSLDWNKIYPRNKKQKHSRKKKTELLHTFTEEDIQIDASHTHQHMMPPVLSSAGGRSADNDGRGNSNDDEDNGNHRLVRLQRSESPLTGNLADDSVEGAEELIGENLVISEAEIDRFFEGKPLSSPPPPADNSNTEGHKSANSLSQHSLNTESDTTAAAAVAGGMATSVGSGKDATITTQAESSLSLSQRSSPNTTMGLSSSFFSRAASIANTITTNHHNNHHHHNHHNHSKSNITTGTGTSIKPYKPVAGPLAETKKPFADLAVRAKAHKRLAYQPNPTAVGKTDIIGLGYSFYSPDPTGSGSTDESRPVSGTWGDSLFPTPRQSLEGGGRGEGAVFAVATGSRPSPKSLLPDNEREATADAAGLLLVARNHKHKEEEKEEWSDNNQNKWHDEEEDDSPSEEPEDDDEDDDDDGDYFTNGSDQGALQRRESLPQTLPQALPHTLPQALPQTSKKKIGFLMDANQIISKTSKPTKQQQQQQQRPLNRRVKSSSSSSAYRDEKQENNTEYSVRFEISTPRDQEQSLLLEGRWTGDGKRPVDHEQHGDSNLDGRMLFENQDSYYHHDPDGDGDNDCDGDNDGDSRADDYHRSSHHSHSTASATGKARRRKPSNSVLTSDPVGGVLKYVLGGAEDDEDLNGSAVGVTDRRYSSDTDDDSAYPGNGNIYVNNENEHVRANNSSIVSGSSTAGAGGISLRNPSKLSRWTLWAMFKGDGRSMSPEEERAERMIEREIDNFIIPDELSPAVLRNKSFKSHAGILSSSKEAVGGRRIGGKGGKKRSARFDISLGEISVDSDEPLALWNVSDDDDEASLNSSGGDENEEEEDVEEEVHDNRYVDANGGDEKYIFEEVGSDGDPTSSNSRDDSNGDIWENVPSDASNNSGDDGEEFDDNNGEVVGSEEGEEGNDYYHNEEEEEEDDDLDDDEDYDDDDDDDDFLRNVATRKPFSPEEPPPPPDECPPAAGSGTKASIGSAKAAAGGNTNGGMERRQQQQQQHHHRRHHSSRSESSASSAARSSSGSGSDSGGRIRGAMGGSAGILGIRRLAADIDMEREDENENRDDEKINDDVSSYAPDDEEDVEMLAPREKMKPEDVENLIIFGETRQAKDLITSGALVITSEEATGLLLKCCNIDTDAIKEPLETFMLLVDLLGADVNARDREGATPLHNLFSRPLLGRFVLSRGADVLAKDSLGDTVLDLCAEYGYDWLLPAFEANGGEAQLLLESPERAHEYAVKLITKWGAGSKVAELVAEGLVTLTADEALELMEECRGNFENMKEPVETFELLEKVILS